MAQIINENPYFVLFDRAVSKHVKQENRMDYRFMTRKDMRAKTQTLKKKQSDPNYKMQKNEVCPFTLQRKSGLSLDILWTFFAEKFNSQKLSAKCPQSFYGHYADNFCGQVLRTSFANYVLCLQNFSAKIGQRMSEDNPRKIVTSFALYCIIPTIFNCIF